MNTIGWLLLLIGGVLVRQVATGRAKDTPTDFRDFFVAFVRGDSAKVQEVGARRGTSLPVIDAPVNTGDAAVATGQGSRQGGSLVSEMKRLAAIANNRYVWGATGPNGYDCSGLVWRACKNLGIYNGIRFTTSTANLIFPRFAKRVSGLVGPGGIDVPGNTGGGPQVGDICVWPGHHMGVVVGPNRMFSAANSRDGILEESISGFRPDKPDYWRITT